MAIEVDAAWSPGWWLKTLAAKLEKKRPALDVLSNYYDGKPPLPTSAQGAQSAYAAFQKKARLNLAELSTEAVLDRMTMTGFDMGKKDPAGNKKLAQVWTENNLDIENVEVHRNMLVRRDGYVIVQGPPRDSTTGVPIVTAEDPRQVVSIHDPSRQSKIRAGAKFFYDPELEMDIAYLYVPGRVWRAFREARHASGDPAVRFSPGSFHWDSFYAGANGIELPDNLMPLVRFRNKEGKGDFETHLDDIDRVNHMILQRMVIATFQAFKQRAIKADKDTMPDRHPDTGELIDYDRIFSADPGAVWRLPAAAEMWESGAVDIGPILQAAKQDVQDYCSMTRTPLYYADPSAGDGSAEGAQTMREAITYKADDRVKRANAGWRIVESTALRLMGDKKRADESGLRAVFLPTERYSLAERADAASKAGEDLPWSQRMAKIWGMSPQEIEDSREERKAEEAAKRAAAPDFTPKDPGAPDSVDPNKPATGTDDPTGSAA